MLCYVTYFKNKRFNNSAIIFLGEIMKIKANNIYLPHKSPLFFCALLFLLLHLNLAAFSVGSIKFGSMAVFPETDTLVNKTLTSDFTDSAAGLDSFAFADDEFIFYQDDPVLAMMDSMMQATYTLSRLERDKTNAGLMNIYDFCPDLAPIYSPSEYAKRLEYLDEKTPFSLAYNKVVHQFIELYALNRREQVSRMLGLAELYFPMFSELLDKYNLPLELKYLAIVESALNPSANSRAGAKGLWQFMYGTGKIYGLEVTSYTDERFDPYQSTVAACEYLSYLHGLYNDWDLALAAYNSGPGRVNSAIRRSGGKRNYWELWNYLPPETRGYVPAFIAVNYIMNFATEHNLYPTPPHFFDYQKDTVVISTRVTFDQISAVLGIPVETLHYLNPMYTKNLIPGIAGERYSLTLPAKKIGDFINNEPAIYSYKTRLEKIDSAKAAIALEKEKAILNETRLSHTVGYGEDIELIAQKYKVSVQEIKEWNGLSNTIYEGQNLTIYTGNENDSATSALLNTSSLTTKEEVIAPKPIPPIDTGAVGTETINEDSANSPGKKFRYHTVQPGDTLWDIAKLYEGVTITQLQQLNQINNAKRLKPGMKLKIAPI